MSSVWVEFRAHKPPKHASTNSRRPKRCIFRWFHFTVVVQVEIAGEIVVVRTVGNTRSHTVIPTFIVTNCDRLNNRCHQAKNRQNRLNFPNQNRQIAQQLPRTICASAPLHKFDMLSVKKANFRQEWLNPQTFDKQRTRRPKSRLQSRGVTFYIRTSVNVVNGIFHSMVLQGGDLSTTGDWSGVAARRVSSPTGATQRHSLARYLSDGALRVKTFCGWRHELSYSRCPTSSLSDSGRLPRFWAPA